MKVKWIVGPLVGFCGVSLALASALYAQSGPTQIFACVNSTSGEVKIVTEGTACNGNRTLVQWDVTGPQGPTGPQGASGPQGPTGPQGPKGDPAPSPRTDPMTFAVDCNAGQKINDALPDLIPGDTLLVSGTCNENVVVHEEVTGVTLDGQGTATIHGAEPTQNTIIVRGRGIVIKDFTVTGGNNVVNVTRGGTATIDGNMIQNGGQHGILIGNASFAAIINNTIQNNSIHGIQLVAGSANIGFRTSQDASVSPNTIQNNGNIGINLSDGSSARIDGNTITGNARFGINVTESSSARIGFSSGIPGGLTGANTIQNNGLSGIRVADASHAGIEGNVIDNNTGAGIGIEVSSSAEIGTQGRSNSVQHNAAGGISVVRSASARISGNVVSNNTGNGVQIGRGSQVDVGNNTIDTNTGDGIRVEENSGLNIFPSANSGTNGQSGIRCRIGGYATGSIGTLTGSTGQKNFGFSAALTENPALSVNSEGCIDRTTP